MSDTELTAKLDGLRELPHETEWVEFKQNYANTEDIGQYLSALSNAAALHGQARAFIVWGVEDGTHRVVGTSFKPRATKGQGNEDLEPWLARGLTPRVDFTIHEFDCHGFRVVLFEIQAAQTAPTRFKDDEFIRVGSHKRRLKEHVDKERKLWQLFNTTGFEVGIAAVGLSEDGVLDRLDYSAYFTRTNQRLPESKGGILARLADESLVVPQVLGRYDITNLGAILFARDLSVFGGLGRKALRVIRYTGSGRLITEREWTDSASRAGYAAGFESFTGYVSALLPENEHIEQALRKSVRIYPDIAVRELLANTLIHQDFSATGAGPMVEIFDDRIEFTNPGEPLVEPDRFIDMPPRSRNEGLAAFMRRVNICEERGSGIDKVIAEIELYQLPPPDFRRPPGSTRVFLYAPRTFAELESAERIRACYQHCVLRYVGNEQMTNASLRNRLAISDKNYSMASRVIADTVKSKLVKAHTRGKSPTYIPHWA